MAGRTKSQLSDPANLIAAGHAWDRKPQGGSATLWWLL